MSFTAISLFCGAGGCSLGFKQAGFQIMYATDVCPVAVNTYKTNFPEDLCVQADIRNLDFQTLRKKPALASKDLDVLIGGPPCQGFSAAGLKAEDDIRNTLIFHYLRAVGDLKPRWFVMENVEGLLTAKKGEYLLELVLGLMALGYVLRVEKVYGHAHGLPQRRKRVIVMGNRLGIPFEFPSIQAKAESHHLKDFRTLQQTLQGLPKAAQDTTEKLVYSQPPSDIWETYLRGTATEVSDHCFRPPSAIKLARIKQLKPGQTMKDLPVELQHASFKRRANRRVRDGTPSEKRGGAPSGLKRLKSDEPCLTITGASTREFIHPVEDRPLTIREAARLQTFTDDFTFLGNSSQKIQQIGNAVPPLLAKMFANHVLQTCALADKIECRGALLGYSLTNAKAMGPALRLTEQKLRALMH